MATNRPNRNVELDRFPDMQPVHEFQLETDLESVLRGLALPYALDEYVRSMRKRTRTLN